MVQEPKQFPAKMIYTTSASLQLSTFGLHRLEGNRFGRQWVAKMLASWVRSVILQIASNSAARSNSASHYESLVRQTD